MTCICLHATADLSQSCCRVWLSVEGLRKESNLFVNLVLCGERGGEIASRFPVSKLNFKEEKNKN